MAAECGRGEGGTGKTEENMYNFYLVIEVPDHVYVLVGKIQGVPGGRDKTSGEFSLF